MTMKKGDLDLTKGGLWKNMFVFSLPLVFSNVLQVLFNMSDIAVVGRFAGQIALGSVGSTALLVAVFTWFLSGIGHGVNSLTARFLGADRKNDVSTGVHTSFIISLSLGIVMAVLGEIFARALLELLGTKSELIEGAELYLRIYYLGLPAVALYNFGSGVFSAAGNTRKPLVFLSSAGVINVLLNLFFVIVCEWDVAGVAYATVISQYVSAFLVIASLFRSDGAYSLSLSKMKVSRDKVRLVLSLGFPAGLQNAVFGIANLFIQAAVNSFDHVMVEGNSAAANADSLIYDVMGAFYVGCSSFIAQNYGAGSKKRVKQSYFVGLAYSFAAGALLGGALLLFGKQFMGIFATDPGVIDAGLKRIGIMGFSYCVSAFMDCSIAASRGLGKTALPTVFVIIGSCVFRVAWVYTVFAHYRTIPSLYLLYIFSWSLTALLEIAYFIHVYKTTFSERKN